MTRRTVCLVAFATAAIADVSPAQDLGGVWVDTAGNRVEVSQVGRAVTLRAGNGYRFTGATRWNADSGRVEFTLSRKYNTVEDTPNLMESTRRALVGDSMVFKGYVDDDGRTLDATLHLSLNRQDLTTIHARFSRTPFIRGVMVVTDNFRDIIKEMDRERSWKNSLWENLQGGTDTRLILVYGQYLPQEQMLTIPPDRARHPGGIRLDAIRSLDPTVRYDDFGSQFKRRRNDRTWTRGETGDAITEYAWKRALDTARTRLPAAEVAAIERGDAILVTATPGAGTLPGPKQFTIYGAAGEWPLAQGTTQAQMRFVRGLSTGKWESVEAALMYDSIAVEVTTRGRFPEPRIDLVLGLNGAPIPSDGPRSISAVRTSDSLVYRTGPIILHSQGRPVAVNRTAMLTSAARRGDTLHAAFSDQTRLKPVVVAIPVAFTPADAVIDALWIEALTIAARTKGVEIPDFSTAARIHVDSFYTVVVMELGTRKTDVRLGHHAAMLLMRKFFVQMMEDYAAFLRTQLRGNGRALLGFRELVRPMMRDPNYPLGGVMVSPPNGGMLDGNIPLRRAFEFYEMRAAFDSRPAVDLYQVQAIEQGIAKLLESMQYSIDKAKAISDNDTRALIELTGHGFEAVMDRLIPRLVKRTDLAAPAGEYRYVPDIDARQWVMKVEDLAKELRANHELGNADTQVVLCIASIVPIAAPAGLARAIFAAALSAVDVADVVGTWYGERRELSFAESASAVLGNDRLDRARAQQTPLWGHAVALLASVVGGAGDAVELLREASVSLARARSARLLAKFEQGGLDALKAMNRAEQTDLLVAMVNARVAGTLDDAFDTRLLRAAQQFETEIVQSAGRTAGRVSGDLSTAPLRSRLAEELQNLPTTRTTEQSRAVRILYDLDDAGFVTNIRIEAGALADAADVAGHQATIRAMQGYTALADESRDLAGRFKRFFSGSREPPIGSVAWEAKLEVEKLPGIIMDDRLARVSDGLMSADEAIADIRNLSEQLAQHRRSLDLWITDPGRGFVAAEGLAPDGGNNRLRERAASINNAPGGLERTRYRPREVNAERLAERAAHIEERTAAAASRSGIDLEHYVLDEIEANLRRSQIAEIVNQPPGLLGTELGRRSLMAMAAFNSAIPPEMRDRLLRIPGMQDVLTDIARGGTLTTGARYQLEIIREFAGTPNGLRVLADRLPTQPYYGTRTDRIGRVFASGSDIITNNGELIQAKSFATWSVPGRWESPILEAQEQAFKDLVRYADQGWRDGGGRRVNGIMTYYLDRGVIPTAAAAGVLDPIADAAATSTALTDWANSLFRHPNGRPIQVRIEFH